MADDERCNCGHLVSDHFENGPCRFDCYCVTAVRVADGFDVEKQRAALKDRKADY